jgi:hypothetical protein
VTTVALPARPAWVQTGRMFVSPLFDYALIGGGLSLLVTALVWRLRATTGSGGGLFPAELIPVVLLVCNFAHFAASTVRLYSKPGAFREFPFLTLGLPLATIGVLTLSVAFAPVVGRQLQVLYLTWSPYHYAAQAYGLALMYCYRSGCRVGDGDRWLLRFACLTPFLHALLHSRGIGIEWILPEAVLGNPVVANIRMLAVDTTQILAFVLPFVWFVRLTLRGTVAAPLISLVVVVANGVWWISLTYLDAFVWAAIFHGLQYLVIVAVFHVKDQLALGSNRQGWVFHVASFYAASLLLGYLLFEVWPFAYVRMGFGLAESMLITTAVINVHHFIVDAYIWRLRRGTNYAIVTETAPAL